MCSNILDQHYIEDELALAPLPSFCSATSYQHVFEVSRFFMLARSPAESRTYAPYIVRQDRHAYKATYSVPTVSASIMKSQKASDTLGLMVCRDRSITTLNAECAVRNWMPAW